MLCIICSEEIRTALGKVFRCGHAFHTECVIAWMNTVSPATCPTCRTGLTLAEGITLYITTEANSPVRRTADLRRLQSLEQENAQLKSTVNSTREAVERITLAQEAKNRELENLQILKNAEVEGLRNQLAEAQRKVESLLALRSNALGESNDNLFEGLEQEEMLQLLKLYQEEKQELLQKIAEASSNAEEQAVELQKLRQKTEESQGEVRKRTRGGTRRDSEVSESVCSSCSMVTVSLISPPGRQTSSQQRPGRATRKRRRNL